MIAIIICIAIIYIIYSKWSDHVENGIQRIEGQIERAKEQNTPPDEK